MKAKRKSQSLKTGGYHLKFPGLGRVQINRASEKYSMDNKCKNTSNVRAFVFLATLRLRNI